MGLLVGVLLVPGCGGQPAESAGGGAGEPAEDEVGGEAVAACELLEYAEVADALGQEVSEGVDDELDAGALSLQACQWMTPAAPFLSVSLSVIGQASITTGESIEAVFDGAADAATDPQPVDGLGDDAFRTDGEVHALAGPYYLTVSTVGGEVPDAALEQLAELAAARL